MATDRIEASLGLAALPATASELRLLFFFTIRTEGTTLYSAIREPDGRFSFVLHVSPERLSSDHAREAVDAAHSLLGELEARTGQGHRDWQRAERHLAGAQLLAEAGRVLLDARDGRDSLRALTQLICRDFAPGCIVYLRRGDRVVEGLRCFRKDVRSRLEDLENWYLARGTAPGGWIDRVLATLEPQVLSDETQSPDGVPLWPDVVETRSRSGDGPSALPTPPRRAIIVPLAAPSISPLGAIAFLSTDDGAGYDGEDLRLAEELGRRCAARLRWEGAAWWGKTDPTESAAVV